VQRWLRDEGTTHRHVLDEVRKELASRYLASRKLSLPEIACLLGFNEESGFSRTYKRWTGESPAQARKGVSASSATLR
jgi:AraC-like DNA-binding protein